MSKHYLLGKNYLPRHSIQGYVLIPEDNFGTSLGCHLYKKIAVAAWRRGNLATGTGIDGPWLREKVGGA